MLFQYTIIFIFKVLHVSSSLNSSSGTVYEQSHVSYINKNTWSEEQLILVKVNDFNILKST
jgi:hypothetical protein